MKPTKWIVIAVLGAYLGMVTLIWLWIGIVKDPEFSENGLFVKHAPTFKVIFYTPLGMSDKTIEDLPNEEKQEELDYQKYVLGK